MTSILIHPHPALREVAKEVTAFDDSLGWLSILLIKLMREARGIGLSAPQIGQSLRICIVDVATLKESCSCCLIDGRIVKGDRVVLPLVLINPVVTIMPCNQPIAGDEGCLSLPGRLISVARPNMISTDYVDLLGKQHNIHCDGLLSRCIQHEIDHLDGKLIIDYVNT